MKTTDAAGMSRTKTKQVIRIHDSYNYVLHIALHGYQFNLEEGEGGSQWRFEESIRKEQWNNALSWMLGDGSWKHRWQLRPAYGGRLAFQKGDGDGWLLVSLIF